MEVGETGRGEGEADEAAGLVRGVRVDIGRYGKDGLFDDFRAGGAELWCSSLAYAQPGTHRSPLAIAGSRASASLLPAPTPTDPPSPTETSNQTHLECLTNHAIPSVVTLLAAHTTSPSFSLDSSSMTTTNSPRPMASMADSTGSKVKGEGRAGAEEEMVELEAVGADMVCGAGGVMYRRGGPGG